MPSRYIVLKTYSDLLHALLMGLMQANAYVEDKLIEFNSFVEDSITKTGIKADIAALEAAKLHAAYERAKHYNAMAAAHTAVTIAERRAADIIEQARRLREETVARAAEELDKVNKFVEGAIAHHN